MVWQDTLITIIIIAFSYALIPQILKGFKKKKGSINLQTSGITATGMLLLALIYTTLGLKFSAILAQITGILWTTLLIQRIIYNRPTLPSEYVKKT